ncbi:uncharacterized protein sall2 [Danio aesculapii]|uniref:uncharacterized protein sall2 n=1 Tax=Danio aesculapii TaxID=1142201 RepID=UPI0024C071B9|nr:uncharacterized protein sall2 [Danio aesculapii]
MSRRKQKRPQHFFSPILNTSWLLQHEEHLAVKSLTSTLAKNSSSYSTPQNCKSTLNPTPPIERLTAPSLTRASHSVVHIPCQPLQLTLNLKGSHLSYIPDIPSHLTYQCIKTTAPTVSTHKHSCSLMASPKLGVSATTTSSSSSSVAASLCVPPHPGSPVLGLRVPQVQLHPLPAQAQSLQLQHVHQSVLLLSWKSYVCCNKDKSIRCR